MLSLFGILERIVSFENLATNNELALRALLPGIANTVVPCLCPRYFLDDQPYEVRSMARGHS